MTYLPFFSGIHGLRRIFRNEKCESKYDLLVPLVYFNFLGGFHKELILISNYDFAHLIQFTLVRAHDYYHSNVNYNIKIDRMRFKVIKILYD